MSSEDIIPGLCGLIANRISEDYNRPVIIASIDKEKNIIKGSGRCCFNTPFFTYFQDYISEFIDIGGHELAFGFTLHSDNENRLKEIITGIAEKYDSSIQLGQTVDAVLTIDEIDSQFIKKLQIFEPVGKDNEAVLFQSKGLSIEEFSRFGKEKNHAKLIFTGNSEVSGIWWNNAEIAETMFNDNNKIDVMYELENNEFRGKLYPRMYLQEVTLHSGEA